MPSLFSGVLHVKGGRKDGNPGIDSLEEHNSVSYRGRRSMAVDLIITSKTILKSIGHKVSMNHRREESKKDCNGHNDNGYKHKVSRSSSSAVNNGKRDCVDEERENNKNLWIGMKGILNISRKEKRGKGSCGA